MSDAMSLQPQVKPQEPQEWDGIAAGTPLALAFLKIDRAGSTREWQELPEAEVYSRRRRYVDGVAEVARQFDASLPLNWQGDGVMLFFRAAEESAAVVAYRAALAIWQRVRLDLNMHARIAVHAALDVAWHPDTGQLAHPAIDVCGHLEHATPVDAISLSEDVYLELPLDLTEAAGPLGQTERDGTIAFVYPAAMRSRREDKEFRDNPDQPLWEAFRNYAKSPDIRLLRYVGLRLTKKEPPSLDLREAFVPPDVETVRVVPRVEPFPTEAMLDAEFPPRLAEGASGGASRETGYPDQRDRTQREVGNLTARIAERRNWIVLGDPGSGKSTIVRWLALLAASGRLALARETGITERLLPVPVSVGRLTELREQANDSPSVLDCLARYFQDRSLGEERVLRSFLARQAEEGHCLFLFDGLDEVRTDQRLEIRSWLEAFAIQYARNRCVVTSRTVGYIPMNLPDGTVMQVRPFGPAQIRRYVDAFVHAYRRWEIGFDDDPGAREAADDLVMAIEAHSRLRTLAGNPFMLSVLALIHRAEGRLPRHRVQAYQIFARTLCETWGAARRLVAGKSEPILSFDEEAIPLLGALALRMHERYPSGVAPADFVVETLAELLASQSGVDAEAGRTLAKAFLGRAAEEIQLLQERGPDEWGFMHLTFQEFFAAVGLISQERFESALDEHLFNPRWEEVFRLGVGYMALIQGRAEAARRVVERVLRRRPKGERAWQVSILGKHIPLATLLAAEAGSAIPVPMRQEIVDAFVDWAIRMPRECSRTYLIHVAGTELRSAIVEGLRKHLKQPEGEHARSAVSLCGILNGKEAVPDLIGILEWDGDIASEAATILADLGAEQARPAIRAYLERQAVSVSTWIRIGRAFHAFFELGGHGRVDRQAPGSKPNFAGAKLDTEDLRLIQILLNSSRAETRRPVAIYVGEFHLTETAGLLAELALRDEDERVRSHAVNSLGSLGLEESVESLIKALDDPDEGVRAEVASALGSIGNQTCVDVLHGLLRSSTGSIRANAARSLAKLGVHAAEGDMLAALDDAESPPNQYWAIAHALVDLNSQVGKKKIEERLRSYVGPWPFESFNTLFKLAQADSGLARETIIRVSRQGEKYDKAIAIEFLSELGQPLTFEEATSILRDRDEEVRESAVRAFQAIGNKEAVPILIEKLADKSHGVRYYVAEALASLGTPEVAVVFVKRIRRGRRDLIAPLWRLAETLDSAS